MLSSSFLTSQLPAISQIGQSLNSHNLLPIIVIVLIVRRFISSCFVRVIFLYKLGKVQVPVFSRRAGILTPR